MYLEIITVAVWNIIVFCAYAYDKHNARHGGRRVSERTLITMTILFGGIGAVCGMYIFHNKTRHLRFNFIGITSFFVTILLCLKIVL